MLIAANVSAAYAGGAKALDSVSFSLNDGESAALIGANGAGKTTLMLSIVGVLPILSGSISANGLNLEKKNLPQFRSMVSLVFQDPDDQLFMPTIYEDLLFGPRNMGLSEGEAIKRADRALFDLGIEKLKGKSPLKMSGGEKRMAAIASVLSMSPSYILFDEPTAFLDPKARRTLLSAVNSLSQAKIIATHDLDFAKGACTRALLLKDGGLIYDGAIDILNDQKALEEAGL